MVVGWGREVGCLDGRSYSRYVARLSKAIVVHRAHVMSRELLSKAPNIAIEVQAYDPMHRPAACRTGHTWLAWSYPLRIGLCLLLFCIARLCELPLSFAVVMHVMSLIP